jgi:hypothetical protein
MKILTNSKEIAHAIADVLRDKSGKRIVAVAYVGVQAIKYLPNPKGISLFCSTEIPGTNPSSLRELKDAGVLIHEVENLHAKVYWGSSTGAVIGSANLSNNGLSENGNHELAILLPSGTFDMENYLETFEPKIIEYSYINRLEKQYNLYMLRNKQPRKGRSKAKSFRLWSEESGPSWKLYAWNEEGSLPKDVIKQFNDLQPGESAYDFMQSSTQNAYDIGGWVLSFRENWKGNNLESLSDFNWFIPQVRIKSNQKNSSNYPFYWIQLHRQLPSSTPFDLSESDFKKAFESTYIELVQQHEKTSTPSGKPRKKFLTRVLEKM